MFSMIGNLIFGAQEEEGNDLQTQEQIVSLQQATDASTQTAKTENINIPHQNHNNNEKAPLTGPKCNDWILINRSEKSSTNVNNKSIFDVGVNTSVMMLNHQNHPVNNIEDETTTDTCTKQTTIPYAHNKDEDQEMNEQFEDSKEEQLVYQTCATREEAEALLNVSTTSECLLGAFFERAMDQDEVEMEDQNELERRELSCLTLLNSNKKEDWLITPLPCLTSITSSQRSIIENHPLENLLIEHPSMSVFVSATSSSCDEEEEEEEVKMAAAKKQLKKSYACVAAHTPTISNEMIQCKVVAIPATKTVATISPHHIPTMQKKQHQTQPTKHEESLAKQAAAETEVIMQVIPAIPAPAPIVKPALMPVSRQMIKKAVAEKRKGLRSSSSSDNLIESLTSSTVGKVLAGIQQSTLPRSKKNVKKAKKSNQVTKITTLSSSDDESKENNDVMAQSQSTSSSTSSTSTSSSTQSRLGRKAESQALKSKKKTQLNRVNKINTFSSIKNVNNKQQRKCHKVHQPAFISAAGSF